MGPMRKEAMNLAYIVIFLRNGGERIRAIWLAKNWFDIELREAKEWVDSVRWVKRSEGTYIDYENGETVKPRPAWWTASHWPGEEKSAHTEVRPPGIETPEAQGGCCLYCDRPARGGDGPGSGLCEFHYEDCLR